MHSKKEDGTSCLSEAQRAQFVHDGFVKLEDAFPSETAAEARVILWEAAGCDPGDRRTWTRPVVRLGDFAQEPFRQAARACIVAQQREYISRVTCAGADRGVHE